MKGMELAENYFEKYGTPMINEKYSGFEKYIAAGLVGEGSECYGFDDETSRDHDFGPGFCIWLPEKIYSEIGQSMQIDYDNLPKNYMNFKRNDTPQGGGRVGVFSVEKFYSRFIGLGRGPETEMEWLRIPESNLATATNGKIFYDNFGRFSNIRDSLLQFYPLDVIKKKLAARSILMAQSGQYNYKRCCERREFEAAYLACSQFVRAAIATAYLINKQYMPFYKWTFKGTENFKLLRNAVRELSKLIAIPDLKETYNKKVDIIETVCLIIAEEYRKQGYTKTHEAFMQVQGEEMMKSIRNPEIAELSILADSVQRE